VSKERSRREGVWQTVYSRKLFAVCRYGLGSNSMTEGQKSLLIFGSLGFFFCLFLLGYLL